MCLSLYTSCVGGVGTELPRFPVKHAELKGTLASLLGLHGDQQYERFIRTLSLSYDIVRLYVGLSLRRRAYNSQHSCVEALYHYGAVASPDVFKCASFNDVYALLLIVIGYSCYF